MISLLPLASFGDIFGYRRVYRFGLVLYTRYIHYFQLAGMVLPEMADSDDGGPEGSCHAGSSPAARLGQR